MYNIVDENGLYFSEDPRGFQYWSNQLDKESVRRRKKYHYILANHLITKMRRVGIKARMIKIEEV